MEEVPEDLSLSLFFPFQKLFLKFPHKFLSSFYVISLALKSSYCHSANHNPELQCVICNGVTLFTLVLDLNYIALSQSESSNLIMYIISSINSSYYT